MDRRQEGNLSFFPYLNNLLLSLYERYVVSGFYKKSKEKKGKNN